MQNSTYKCFQCGSALIFVSSKTEIMEGSRSPLVSSIYRCSNAECQAEKDEETAKRVKLRKERLELSTKRAADSLKKKKKGKKR